MEQDNVVSLPAPETTLDIKSLNLSTRTRTKLKNTTGAELLKYSESDLLKKLKLSNRSLAELKEELEKIQIYLKQ